MWLNTQMADKIYRLVDPRDGAVRYIGKTRSTLNKRLHGHLQETRLRRCACGPWINELKSAGLRPKIELVETVADGTFWAERECFWIAQYRATGAPLLNIGPGGRGNGKPHSESVRAHLAELGRKRFSDVAAREIVSIRQRKYWTPEARAAQRARMLAQLQDPEKLLRLRAGLNAAQRSPEYRRKRSEIMLGQWSDPEMRGKMTASMKGPKDAATT